MKLPPDRVLIRYLLGQSSSREQSVIEESYFTDLSFFEHMLVVEDELIDMFLRDELATGDRRRFETHFLTAPGRREKLDLARTLFERVNAGTVQSAPRRSANLRRSLSSRIEGFRGARAVTYRWLAAAFVIVAVFVAWLLTRNHGSSTDVGQRYQANLSQPHEPKAQPQAAQSTDIPTSHSKGLEVPRQQPAALHEKRPLVISLALTPGVSRSIFDINQPLVLPRGADAVRLKLMLETRSNYKRYVVELRGPAGDTVRTWNLNRPPRTKIGSLTISVPARALHSGDYLITVSGVSPESPPEVLDDYSVRIRKATREH